MAKNPGLFDSFKGLWSRGHIDSCPRDHFPDSLNNTFAAAGVCSRDGTILYNSTTSIIRMALYKPNPPFSGTNVPRIIALKSNGDLVDLLLSQTLYSNALMKDFGFVNFFGRCFISPSDGKVGLNGVNLKIYDGTGTTGIRDAGGIAPTVAPTGAAAGGGTLSTGDYIFAYAWETASGFVTKPSPFLKLNFNYFPDQGTAQLTGIAVGPTGTAARWIIANKVIPYPTEYNGNPYNYPLFFAVRIADNTTTSYNLSFYDENLVDSADYLMTQAATIPAGVGLLDYKGRLISYGEYSNPSIVRVSEIGEPEAFSETSGFFITDPSDSTGVRSATEFRGSLYVYKQQRGYVTDDNLEEASTWTVLNFEKSIGTQQYGIAAVLDAKGSSSEGFIIASTGALHYFNGTTVEPELSYKIRDLWGRINKNYFHLVQVANDPINRRLYILAPLNDLDADGNIITTRTAVSHIIFGDYRDGLDPFHIKWDIWKFSVNPTSILIYTDFTGNVPSLVTRISNLNEVLTLNIGIPGNDNGIAIDSYFQLAPVRFSKGISQFNRVRLDASGSCRLELIVSSKDQLNPKSLQELSVISDTPGKEFTRKMNVVSEQCTLKVRCANLNQAYKINSLEIEGQHLWDERPG